MNKSSHYDTRFFEGRSSSVESSAEVLVPLMHRLFAPRSVVDVGCGDGAWLAQWLRSGVARIQGIDGPWVQQNVLKIPINYFCAQDLNQPFSMSECFDLCTSFEVAEHLAPENAAIFVKSLTQLSDLVVFSAAVPGQGGTGHTNEQWQEYWIDQFAACDYLAIDAISPHVWTSTSVQPCYLQNILVYVRSSRAEQYAALGGLAAADKVKVGRRIHPRMWAEKIVEGQDLTRFGLSTLLRSIPKAVKNSVSQRFFKSLS